MDSTASFRAPRRWLRVGKYLLPVGGSAPGGRPTRSPREQIRVAKLAAEHPECVALTTVGAAEVLPEFQYICHHSGQRELRALPAQLFPPAFVATLRNGLSYGRHCCVIGPAGKAVRETGFYLDGDVQTAKVSGQPVAAAVLAEALGRRRDVAALAAAKAADRRPRRRAQRAVQSQLLSLVDRDSAATRAVATGRRHGRLLFRRLPVAVSAKCARGAGRRAAPTYPTTLSAAAGG